MSIFSVFKRSGFYFNILSFSPVSEGTRDGRKNFTDSSNLIKCTREQPDSSSRPETLQGMIRFGKRFYFT